MRKTLFISLLAVIVSCNPDGIGCFEPSGNLETSTINVQDYTRIDISGNIDLKVSSQPGTEVTLTAGSNVAKGIRIEVVEGVLYLDNLNRCNWSRKYINPVVEVSTDLLTRIHSRGHGLIESSSTLNYDRLELVNEGGSADFRMDLNVRELKIISNAISNYHISGVAEFVDVDFFFTDGIFYGQELITRNASIYHRGSNSIHLNVSDSISGEIGSLGNVFVYQQMPMVVDVLESSSGKLIFNE